MARPGFDTRGGSVSVIPAFSEAVSLGLGNTDTNSVPTDDHSGSITGTFSDSNTEPSEAVLISLPSPSDSSAAPSDASSAMGLVAQSDSNATPTDATITVGANLTESSAAPTEAVSLSLPSPSESNATPGESRTNFARFFMTGGAGSGVGTPANSNGKNDGATARIETQALASTTETLSNTLGVNVPNGFPAFTTLLFRGWFTYTQTLGTSSGQILATSNGALFTDITILSLTANQSSGGTFTFDLLAAGVNTLAKVQSLEMRHSTTDAAAGVSPAVLLVDAGSLDFVLTI